MHRKALGTVTLISWLLLAGVSSAAAAPIRIMAMGDSQTQGCCGGAASYRYDLWFMLRDAGYEVDFVGRQKATSDSPDPQEYPLYTTQFDRDHEGFSGWRTDQLADSAADPAFSQHLPDVLLLMAGGNDVGQSGAGGVANADIHLREIIEKARAHVPDIVILLAKFTPMRGTGSSPYHANAEFIAPLNEAIEKVAADLDSASSPVILVDNNTGFDVNTMFQRDGLHANRVGEQWIASNWFESLEAVLPGIETNGFSINPGLSDAWFNPLTDGQGFFIIVWEDIQTIFLSWFTYDTSRPSPDVTAMLGDPGHRWLTAQGPYNGDRAVLDVYLTSGGAFDASLPAPAPPQAIGTAEIEWSDCNAGTLTYDLPDLGLAGLIPIERVVLDNVAMCEALME